MLHSIPIFNEKNKNVFRRERRGCLSFRVANIDGSTPWVLNRTGAEVLSLCDGRHDVSQIVACFSEKYRKVHIDKLRADIVSVLTGLTQSGCITWRCEKVVGLASNGECASLVTSRILPYVHMFLVDAHRGLAMGTHFAYELEDVLAESPMAMGGRTFPERSYVSFNSVGAIESALSVARIRDKPCRIYLLTRFACLAEGVSIPLPEILKICATEDCAEKRGYMSNAAARVIYRKDMPGRNVMREMLLGADGATSVSILGCECGYGDIVVHELPLIGC